MLVANALTASGAIVGQLIAGKRVVGCFFFKRRSFYVEQKEKQVEIAARILEEQKQMKRRKQLQPHLYPDAKAKAEKVTPGRLNTCIVQESCCPNCVKGRSFQH